MMFKVGDTIATILYLRELKYGDDVKSFITKINAGHYVLRRTKNYDGLGIFKGRFFKTTRLVLTEKTL